MAGTTPLLTPPKNIADIAASAKRYIAPIAKLTNALLRFTIDTDVIAPATTDSGITSIAQYPIPLSGILSPKINVATSDTHSSVTPTLTASPASSPSGMDTERPVTFFAKTILLSPFNGWYAFLA